MGGSLFLVFLLLAALNLFQAMDWFSVQAIAGVKIEALYLAVSFLLLTVLVHLESRLVERIRQEHKERQICAELGIEVKRQTVHLVKALEGLQTEMDERQRLSAETSCLDRLKPRLFDCFSEMIDAIPARSVVRALVRESHMLGVDLLRQRPLMAAEVGSILIFSRFVAAGGKNPPGFTPVALPPRHTAFYQATIERLIEAGELPSAARAQFDRLNGQRESAPAIKPLVPAFEPALPALLPC